MDALEEMKAVAFGYGFRPPVLSLDIYHVVPDDANQESLASLADQKPSASAIADISRASSAFSTGA